MKKVALTIAASLFITGFVFATVEGDSDQGTATHSVSIEIPTVALVDVESEDGGEAGVINLSPNVESLEAGEAVNFGSAINKKLWLNYTSVVDAGDNAERQITVALDDADNLPNGVSLLVSAGSISSGKGKKGSTVEGKVTIGTTAQNLVTGIGSCYTESGSGKGHQLTYELDMNENEYANLVAKDYEVQITYTITGE